MEVSVMNDLFRFSLPLDLIKSEKEDGEMRIQGYASTEDEDRQGDSILQKGLDISDFVNSGWFNYDHDNQIILGYPDKEKTRIDRKGFWVEGTLLKSVKLAHDIFDISRELIKSNAPRRFGFSVEGKTLERDDWGKIVKAKVYNVAITPNPVNTKTSMDVLLKSFSTELLDKSMEAGYSTNVGDVTSGACLKKEDLESAFRVLAKALGGNEDASSALSTVKSFLNKSMDSNELALYFQLSKGLSRQEAVNLVKVLNNREWR